MMFRPRYSLANLMLSVLFIGAVCATLHYARRASQLRAELAAEMEELRSAKNQQFQAIEEVFVRRMTLADQEMQKGYDFQTRTTVFVIDSLRGDIPGVRRWAAQLLGEMYPDAVVAAAFWKVFLEDSDEGGSRREAVHALKKVEELITALKGALQDDDESVRKAAADALKKIGAEKPGTEDRCLLQEALR